MKQNVLKVHPGDNVIVVLKDLAKDEIVSCNWVGYEVVDAVLNQDDFIPWKRGVSL